MAHPQALDPGAVEELRTRLVGSIEVPGDPGYDRARRVWNGMIEAFPDAVVQVGAVADVAPALAFANSFGRTVAVRGGGHNVAGHGTVDGGVVIDLARLNAVAVDPGARTVHVEGGATLADIDRACEPFGLSVPVGVISATGIGGLALGGGIGWRTRSHGLTADNMLSAEVVTASGELVAASEQENPDLLWGLRGGGGNFGVVTSFTFRAHPIPDGFLCGNLVYGRDRWRDAWHAFGRWTTGLPDAMTSITTTFVPPAAWGIGDEPVLVVGFMWDSPDRAAGERHLAALTGLCPPDDQVVDPMPWTGWQSAADEMFPRGVRAYWRNTSFDRLDDEVLDVLVRRGGEQAWYGTAFDVHHMGGAFARVPAEATPFPNRSARFWINVYGFWDDPADDADRVAFVRAMGDDMLRFSTGGRYVNFQGREGTRGSVPGGEVYDPATYARLARIKRRYDPDNVFRINHNIVPG